MNDIQCLTLKSQYNTGKTQLLKPVIEKYKFKRILFVSYRISLSVDLMNNFKYLNFKSYLDKDYKADKLIIQIESIQKINNEFIDDYTQQIPSYDLVIIDESESVLNQFSSNTFKEAKNCFIFFSEVLKNSKKILFMDGDLGERTFDFVDSINATKSMHIVNKSIFDKKIYNIINDRNGFINYLIDDLNNNLNIAIISQSRRQCDDYKKLLLQKFPNKIIKIYTSLTDDFEKKKDVNIEWKNANVIIYSPTIEAGVSFDHDNHFNKIYGILSANSTSQRSYLQMLARIRKVKNNKIIILNDISFKIILLIIMLICLT